jgi:hypothetical protein
MEHNYNLPLTDEQWAKLEPIILPPEASASTPPCSQLFKHPFFGCQSIRSLDASNQ